MGKSELMQSASFNQREYKGEPPKDEFRRGIIRLPAEQFVFDGTPYRLNREENGKTVFYHDCIPRREANDAVFDLSTVTASFFMKG